MGRLIRHINRIPAVDISHSSVSSPATEVLRHASVSSLSHSRGLPTETSSARQTTRLGKYDGHRTYKEAITAEAKRNATDATKAPPSHFSHAGGRSPSANNSRL